MELFVVPVASRCIGEQELHAIMAFRTDEPCRGTGWTLSHNTPRGINTVTLNNHRRWKATDQGKKGWDTARIRG